MAQKPIKKPLKKVPMTETSIGLDILHTMHGDLGMVLESDNPKDRKKLAKKIMDLIRKDKALIVVKLANKEEVRITGYDPVTNEWITKPLTKQEEASRVSAAGSVATAVAPISGG